MAATILTCTLTGVVDSDDVSLTGGTATFADKNVGNGKTVTATGLSLTGTKAGNYQLSSTSATTTANITAKTVTPSITADSKTYDRTTTATLSSQSVSGVIAPDVVTLTVGAANFDTKDVGTNKTVTATGLSLSGADAGNYTLNGVTTATAKADITAKTVTPSIAANSKTYDRTTTATLSSQSVSGVIAPDVVTLTVGAANFDTKDVGTNKTVTATGLSLSGADAGNYTLNGVTTATAMANITAKHITGSFTADNKQYDGNNSATVLTRSLTGVIGLDDVSLTGGTATFADKNVGMGKTVTLTGASLSGVDAGNYVLDSVATTTANITAKHITGSFTADNKQYDGNNSATVLTRSLTGVIGLDDVSLTGGTATFADKNVGMGKTVTLTGASLSGVDAGNYVLDSVATTTANITAKHITGSFTADNKQYDGNNSATVLTRSLTGVIGLDNVSLTGSTATFADKNVGMGKTVTLTGASLSGVDAGNYVLDSVATTTADITPAPLTITANNKSKVFGAPLPTLDASYSGFVPGEGPSNLTGTLSCTTTAVILSNVGTYPITCSGQSSTNYSITYVGGTLTITQATTTTTVTSSANPSILNQSVTFTATVSPQFSGTPAGTVTFKDGATTLGTGALSGGVATFSTSSLAVNAHSITAVYGGDGNFTSSTSSALSQVVQFAPFGTTCLGAPGHAILQPIDLTGASVFPKKQGSTVPAKFRVCDAGGSSIGTSGVVSNFQIIQIYNGTVYQTVTEDVTSTTPDTAFRWDPTAMQWIYNISTKPLSAGNTYYFRIYLSDGTNIDFQFGLK